MRIAISEWADLYPRNDYKSLPWLRLESNIGHAKGLFGLAADQKWVWITLLGLAAQANEDGNVDAELSYIAAYAGVDETRTRRAIHHFARKSLIKILEDEAPSVNGSRTDGVREVNGLRTDGVRYVTERNERNETNVTYGSDGMATGTGGMASVGTDGNDAMPPDGMGGMASDATGGKKPGRGRKPPVEGGKDVWEAYRSIYVTRYGHEPVRNARTNAQCAQLVGRLGKEAAIKVVAFYLTHQGRYYVQTCHGLGACLKDAEALHTQMLAGHRVSSSEATAKDRQQGTIQAFANVARKFAAEDAARKEVTGGDDK